jgi:hypothetical protein
VHSPTEERSGNKKDSFYEVLQHVLEEFPKNYVTFLGDFNSRVGREVISKPTMGNKGLHDSSVNEVRVVDFATSRNLIAE